MRAPITVRIHDGDTDRSVTRHVRGLRIRRTAPGGFAQLQMRLDLPRTAFYDLGPADRVWVYDALTGEVLFEGFIENPGDVDGDGGQGFDLTAVGTQILASDTSQPLHYIDRDLDLWQQYVAGASATSSSADTSDDPTGATPGEGLLTQFNPGQPIGTNYVAQSGYEGFRTGGLEFGALYVALKSGKIDANFETDLAWATSGGSAFAGLGGTLKTDTVTGSRFVGAGEGHPPAGSIAIALRLRRTGGATNVIDDDTWSWFHDVRVLGRRMNRHGQLVTGLGTGATADERAEDGMAANDHVRASWVVADLLGRVLTQVDAVAAVIEPTTAEIDQLVYRDGAKARQVLDDLQLFEPDMLWEILESGPSGYRFTYRRWATAERYVISTRDGYRAPGADTDLCNRIAIYWDDAKGNRQTTIVTASSEQYPSLMALEVIGRVKDADPITLPAGRGSEANAQLIGQQILAEKAGAPKAATATVRRRVLDLYTGAYVWPWQILPGHLVRVQETGDLQRLTEVEYDDAAGASTLTLGTPVLTEDQRIARLDAVGAGR
ncbi:hypothetical protein [Microcystis phage MinS1]|nr:hypothetical protein [Microcystis phage MinS1]